MFVGGHQAVSVSSDGGATWAAVPSLAGADAMGWSFNNTTIWVGGHPGLAKTTLTTDTVQDASLSGTDIHALGGDDRVMYAAGPGIGFIKSVDDAASWITVSATSGQSFFGRVLVDPRDVNHVVVTDAGRGVLASRDGGATWEPLTSSPSSWVSSPDGLATLYASGGDQATVSTDGGATWSACATAKWVGQGSRHRSRPRWLVGSRLRRPLVEHRIPRRFRFMQRQASVQRPARVVDPVRVEHMRRPVRIEHQPQLQAVNAVMVATAC